MKKILIVLILSLAVTVAFAAGDGQYAKVVNVSTNLNIRENSNAQSEILGKIGKDEVVEVLDVSDDGWTQVKYGTLIGYVKSTFLEYLNGDQQENQNNGLKEWSDRYRFYILFGLSVIVFFITRSNEQNLRMTVLKFVVYALLLTVGLMLVNKNAYLENDLDCWIENKKWISHAFNVLMLSFYMYTLINGYICTGNSLAMQGTKSETKATEVSVVFFLWLVPLLVVGVLLSSVTMGIPLVLIAGLAIWKLVKNCKLMWPRIHYAFLILILGMVACLAIALVFFNLMGQIVLLAIYALLFFGFLKTLPKTISETQQDKNISVPSYIQINDTPHGKHYCDEDGTHLLNEYDGFMEDERGNRFDYNGNKI